MSICFVDILFPFKYQLHKKYASRTYFFPFPLIPSTARISKIMRYLLIIIGTSLLSIERIRMISFFTLSHISHSNYRSLCLSHVIPESIYDILSFEFAYGIHHGNKYNKKHTEHTDPNAAPWKNKIDIPHKDSFMNQPGGNHR